MKWLMRGSNRSLECHTPIRQAPRPDRASLAWLVVLLVLSGMHTRAALADEAIILASEDIMVWENHAGSFNGQNLFIGSSAGEFRTYLLFDVMGDIPAGSNINSVTLELNYRCAQSVGSTSFIFGRALLPVDESMTWDTQPGTAVVSTGTFSFPNCGGAPSIINFVDDGEPQAGLVNHYQLVIDGARRQNGIALISVGTPDGNYALCEDRESGFVPRLKIDYTPPRPVETTFTLNVQESDGACIAGSELTRIQLLRFDSVLRDVDPTSCSSTFDDLEVGSGYSIKVWANDMLVHEEDLAPFVDGLNVRSILLPERAALDGRVLLANCYTPDPGATVRLRSHTGQVWRLGDSTGDGGMRWGGSEDKVFVYAATQPGESWRVEATDRFGDTFTSTVLTEMQPGVQINDLNVCTRNVSPGVTILIHGFVVNGEGVEVPDWVPFLDDFDPIDDYWEDRWIWNVNEMLPDEFDSTDWERGSGPDQSHVIAPILRSFGGGHVFQFERESNRLQMDARFATNSWHDEGLDAGTHVIIVHDWARQSNDSRPGTAEAAADALFASLFHPESEFQLDLNHPKAAPGIHIIAHSRGTTVASELAQRLIAHGFNVDMVTYLEAHDFDEDDVYNSLIDGLFSGFGDSTDGTFNDPAVQWWDGVQNAENYWQSVAGVVVPLPSILIPNPSGHAHAVIGNPYGVDIELNGKTGFVFPHLAKPWGHGLVIDWYMDTIGRDRPAPPNWYIHEFPAVGSGFSSWLASGGFDTQLDSVPGLADPRTFENLEPYPGETSIPEVGPDYDDNFANPLFVTGDFELEGLAAGQYVGLLGGPGVAGWSFYGGGGRATVVQLPVNSTSGYDQSYLELSTAVPSLELNTRTHDYQVVPRDADLLVFKRAVAVADSSARLLIEYIPADSGSAVTLYDESVDAVSGWLYDSARIDGSGLSGDIRGTVGRLRFSIVSDQGPSVVLIDSIQWGDLPPGSVAIASTASVYQVTQGRSVEVPLQILRENYDGVVDLSVDDCLPGAMCHFEPGDSIKGSTASLIVDTTKATLLNSEPYTIIIQGDTGSAGVPVSSLVVEIDVVPAPQPMLVVAPEQVEFGMVEVPYCGSFVVPTGKVIIGNRGDAPLTIDEWSIENVEVFQSGQWVAAAGVVFEATPGNPAGADGDVVVMPGGGAAMVLVSFDPPFREMYRAQLVISSNDPKHPATTVSIFGAGIDGAPCPPENPSPAEDALDVDPEIGTLCWDVGPGALSTRIVVSLSPDLSSPIVDTTVPGDCVLVPQLAGESTYFWRATSINTSGLVNGPIWSFQTAPTPLCYPADFNGDGSINANDVNAFINAFTSGDVTADVNMDGAINGNDVNLFITAYSVGCS